MSDEKQDELVSQRRFEELSARVNANRADIEALRTRVDVDQELIAAIDAQAALGLERASQLQVALRTSRKIGAAMGIIMAERKLGETDAFAVLCKASQDTNRKLRDIAEAVVETGDASGLPQL
ncbi:ANTAR domain-containing protein [Phycicoccus sp. Root101]|uniref:ANTAR domain-containing protein n=1 Tax=Phycicoccus sp. Root101 TaxID=1736421 RepID=UPI0007038BB0|nr:ANTAR domain-containing protein [Phycicoccus sp. Root101]KQU68907.1 hypothetical protein ASC58_09590 [Phycicoccus sp. Root101]